MTSVGKRKHHAEQMAVWRLSHPQTEEQKAHNRQRQKVRDLKKREQRAKDEEERLHLKIQNEKQKKLIESLESDLYETRERNFWLEARFAEVEEDLEKYQDLLRKIGADKKEQLRRWEENPFIERLKKAEVRCKEAINYTWSEFEELLTEFGPLIERQRIGSFVGTELETYCSDRPTKYPAGLALFVTLFWCKSGLPQGLLATILVPLHQRNIVSLVLRVLSAVAPELRKEIRFPEGLQAAQLKEELKNMVAPEFEGIVSAVDGTETRVRRGSAKKPSPAEKAPEAEQYSVKKKQHSSCWTIIATLTGVIIFLSPPSWSHNDQTVWNAENLRQLFIDSDIGVFGDGGYHFNTQLTRKAGQPDILGATPIRQPSKRKKSETGGLTEAEKRHNKNLSQSRVVVENVFAHCKHWAVLSFLPVKGDNDYKLGFLALVLSFLVPLVNRKLKAKSLRNPNWTHPSQRQDSQ